jgi:hypothetical protein
MQRTVLLLIAAAIAIVLVLFAAFRNTGEETGTPTTATADTTETIPLTTGETTTEETTTAETTTEEATTEETTTEAPPPPPPPRAESIPATIRIMVRGGVPVGGVVRETVRQGRRVRIVVRSDAPHHAHLPGYDIRRDGAPGRPAQIVFRATIPGQFEVELEDAGLQIADLEVRP